LPSNYKSGQRRVDRAGERDIAFGHAIGIVRGQPDIDAVVYVGPFGVMVGGIGRDRDLRHEADGFGAARETEPTVQRIAGIIEGPAVQAGKRRVARLGRKRGHANTFSSGVAASTNRSMLSSVSPATLMRPLPAM